VHARRAPRGCRREDQAAYQSGRRSTISCAAKLPIENPSRSILLSPTALMNAMASCAIWSTVSGVTPVDPPTPTLSKVMQPLRSSGIRMMTACQGQANSVNWRLGGASRHLGGVEVEAVSQAGGIIRIEARVTGACGYLVACGGRRPPGRLTSPAKQERPANSPMMRHRSLSPVRMRPDP